MANDKVQVIIEAVDKASGNLKKIDGAIKNVGDTAKKSSGGLGSFSKILGSISPVSLTAGGAILALGGFLKSAVAEAANAERVMGLTEAVIKSTGGAAGYTADEIAKLALAEARLTGIDDEVVQSGMNVLLTFTNIGKDTLPLATRAVEDMAVAMAKGDSSLMDLNGAATQLGKALQDPIYGMTTLKRVGIQFSDAQEQQIKDFMKVNDLASAQAVILDKLAEKFGGAAEKAGESFSGEMAKLNVEWDNFKEEVGKPIIITVTGILQWRREEAALANQIEQSQEQMRERLHLLHLAGIEVQQYGPNVPFQVEQAWNKYVAERSEMLQDQEQYLYNFQNGYNVILPLEDQYNSDLEVGVATLDRHIAKQYEIERVQNNITAAVEETTVSMSEMLDQMDRNIESPLSNFIADIRWFLATGGAFEAAFAKVQAQMDAGLMSPAAASALTERILGAVLLAKIEIGEIDWDEATDTYAKSLLIPPAQARAELEGIAATDWKAEFDVGVEYTGTNGPWPPPSHYEAWYDIYGKYIPDPNMPPGGKYTPRQHGGPVATGMPYLVGEMGPELFVPNNNGRIVPNNHINISGGVNMMVTQGMNGKKLFDEFINELSRQTRNAGTSAMMTAGRVG